MIPTSFLYQTNPFSDVNTMIAMGRGIVHGQIPFVTLFEQRGPYMYMLHTIGALPGNALHWVYLLELLNFYWLYRIIIKTINIYPHISINKSRYYSAFLISTYLFAESFFWGATPEEFVMVPTAYTIYVLLKSISQAETTNFKITNLEIFFIGLGFGWSVMVKFADIGVFVGFYFTIGMTYLITKQFKKFGKTVSIAFLGLFSAMAPALIFYSVIGKLHDFIYQYFSANSGLSAYSPQEMIVKIWHVVIMDALSNGPYLIIMGIPAIITILQIAKLPKLRFKMMILSVISIQFVMSLLIMRYSQAYTGPLTISTITLMAWSAPSLFSLFKSSAIWLKIFLVSEFAIVFIILASVAGGMFLRLDYTLIYQNPKVRINKYSASYIQGNIVNKYNGNHIEAYGFVPLSIYEYAQSYPNLKYFDQTTIPYDSQPDAGDSQYDYIKTKKADWIQTQVDELTYMKKDKLTNLPQLVSNHIENSLTFNTSAVQSITPKSDAPQQRRIHFPQQYYSLAYVHTGNKFSIFMIPPKVLISNYAVVDISPTYDTSTNLYWHNHKIKQSTGLALLTTKENAKKHHMKTIPLKVIE